MHHSVLQRRQVVNYILYKINKYKQDIIKWLNYIRVNMFKK